MKHFDIYRKLVLITGAVISVLSVLMVFFARSSPVTMLWGFFGVLILFALLLLLDFLHNRYNDDLLEQITLLIEALVEQQERQIFSEAEDTLTARLQHQLLKLRNILTAQNQMLAQEKEQIKTLISDISHQIKTLLRQQIHLPSCLAMGNCLRKKEQNILPLCRCHLEN